MKVIEFYKSIYDRENIRRETLNDSINLPFGIISGIFTALTFILTSYRHDNFWLLYFIYGLGILCVILCCISAYYLAESFSRFYKGHKYRELPLLKVIEGYNKELKKYYKKKHNKANSRFEEYIIQELVTYTDNNIEINDMRSLALYKAKKYIFFALVIMGVILVPYLFFFAESQL